PSGTRRRARAGVGSEIGKMPTSGFRSGVHSWASWMNKADSTGKKHSPTAASPRQKKGLVRRQNQTRQGYEVDGGGKRRRYSSGSSTHLGVAARSHADRIDAGACGGAASGPGPATQEPQTADLRQSRRQRPAAYAAQEAGHRLDLPAQGQPH